MTLEEGMHYNAFLRGYLMQHLDIIACIQITKELDLSPENRESLIADAPDMPEKMAKELVECRELDEKQQHRRWAEIYEKYADYIVTTPAYNQAEVAAKDDYYISKYEHLLTVIAENYKNCGYEANESMISVIIKTDDSALHVPDYMYTLNNENNDTKSRMDAIEILSSQALKTLDDSMNIRKLAKFLYKAENEEYKTYRYLDSFITVKDSEAYIVYKIAKVDTSKPWEIIYNEKYQYEYIYYPKNDPYNRVY